MVAMAERDVKAGFLRHIQHSVMKSAPHAEISLLHILGYQIKEKKLQTKGYDTEK